MDIQPPNSDPAKLVMIWHTVYWILTSILVVYS